MRQPELTSLRPTIGGIALIPIWLILNLVILRANWQAYREAQLPLHGNQTPILDGFPSDPHHR